MCSNLNHSKPQYYVWLFLPHQLNFHPLPQMNCPTPCNQCAIRTVIKRGSEGETYEECITHNPIRQWPQWVDLKESTKTSETHDLLQLKISRTDWPKLPISKHKCHTYGHIGCWAQTKSEFVWEDMRMWESQGLWKVRRDGWNESTWHWGEMRVIVAVCLWVKAVDYLQSLGDVQNLWAWWWVKCHLKCDLKQVPFPSVQIEWVWVQRRYGVCWLRSGDQWMETCEDMSGWETTCGLQLWK